MRHSAVWSSSVLVLGALARLAEASPEISISPSPIPFYGGPAFASIGGPPGEQQRGRYEVRNTGDAPLVVTDMAITGPDAGIMTFDGAADPFCGDGRDCPHPFSLAPGEARRFSVRCTAAQAGYFAGSLEVTSNAASGASTAPLSCVGLRPPIIQISPASLDFGIAHVCEYGTFCPPCTTRPLEQTLTITNAAADPSRLDFYITPTLLSGPYEDFTVSDLCPEDTGCSVPAGGSKSIAFTFHPRFAWPYSYPLTLVSRYPGQAPIEIPFYAEGGRGRLEFDSPALLGSAPLGETVTTTYTVHNSGRSCLNLRGPFSSAPEIYPVGSYPEYLELQSGQSYSWTLACTPTLARPVSTPLDFFLTWEATDLASQDVYCIGLGGALDVSPPGIWFTLADEVPVGASGTQRVTVRNAGNLPTDLVAITSSDPHFTAALVGGSLPLTLAPDETVEVDLTFTPTAPGSELGTIAFDAATGIDFTLDIYGDGVVLEAAIAPAAVDFGVVAHPEAPARQLTLHNTGTRALAVTGVALDLPSDFTVTGIAAGATIEAGEALGFEVRATPTMLGQRHARLVIDLDRIPDLTVPLDALAVDPALVVTTADGAPGDYVLDFGGVDVDVGPRLRTATLRNTTAAPIAIAACAVAGDAELAVASACPFTIPPGAAVDLAIAFAPTAEAASTATLTLTGAGFATGALRLGLRGRGLDQHVALSALSLAFPDTFRHPREAATRTVTVRNTGAAELALTAIRVDGAGFSLIGPATAVLAPGAAQDLAIGFAPAAVGDAIGHLVLGNADDPQIARVALAGRGVDRTVEVHPLTVDLGTVTAGTTVRLGGVLADAISIRNIDATATFTISAVSASGSPAFHLIGPDRASLAPGERATLDVELAADTAGRHDATISVFLDGDPEPHARISITAQVVPTLAASSGCGCSSGGPAQGGALAAALLLLLRRRRG